MGVSEDEGAMVEEEVEEFRVMGIKEVSTFGPFNGEAWEEMVILVH